MADNKSKGTASQPQPADSKQTDTDEARRIEEQRKNKPSPTGGEQR